MPLKSRPAAIPKVASKKRPAASKKRPAASKIAISEKVGTPTKRSDGFPHGQIDASPRVVTTPWQVRAAFNAESETNDRRRLTRPLRRTGSWEGEMFEHRCRNDGCLSSPVRVPPRNTDPRWGAYKCPVHGCTELQHAAAEVDPMVAWMVTPVRGEYIALDMAMGPLVKGFK